MSITRRTLLSCAAATLTGAGVIGWATPGGLMAASPPAPARATGTVAVTLTAKERHARILPAPAGESPVITYSDGTRDVLPVIRIKHGQTLEATLVNGLTDHTSIHWHGIRLPNSEDGVPFLTQPPVKPGESYTYRFTPPDAGSFFFHPHCDTVTLLGRGLAGVLIVEDNDGPKYDADIVTLYKDWALNPDGSFGTITTDRGAGRAGSFGTIATVNGQVEPVIDVPANGDIRVRLYNIDSSRVIVPELDGAGEAFILAVDGVPVPPMKLDGWMMGPAMRLDLLFRAPKQAGATVRLRNSYASEPRLAATFRSVGAPRPNRRFAARPLPAHDIPMPDLKRAETRRFNFSATAVAQTFDAAADAYPLADSLCLSQKTFWAINQQSWPQDGHQRLPPPVMALKTGQSYIFELANLTPHLHPIHIHGYTFLVLESDQRKITRHHADTVLLEPKEVLKVAIKADNPGDWMFHCHIIEHQDTGMMGYLRVA